ncbi:hypothetical protein K502DRAFT_322696 [Neoconidiobolus thromboides FSU 785]|nr:hypothetical protein K502DRAFT_322696 [Neoconidiobolus thromboides FSU 785]
MYFVLYFISYFSLILADYAINDPVDGTVWYTTKAATISWYFINDNNNIGSVNIDIVRGDPNDLKIVTSLGERKISDKQLLFTIPDNFVSGGDYAVKLTDSNGNYKFSHFFQVVGRANDKQSELKNKITDASLQASFTTINDPSDDSSNNSSSNLATTKTKDPNSKPSSADSSSSSKDSSNSNSSSSQASVTKPSNNSSNAKLVSISLLSSLFYSLISLIL